MNPYLMVKYRASYLRMFYPDEDTRVFDRKTEKWDNVSSAAIDALNLERGTYIMGGDDLPALVEVVRKLDKLDMRSARTDELVGLVVQLRQLSKLTKIG